MRNISKCFFAVLLLLGSAQALAEPGFFPVDSDKAPAAVAQGASAVYRYVYFLEEPRIIKKDQYDEMINDRNPNYYNRLRARVAKQCKAEDSEACEFYIGGTGTAFVVGKNRDHILTARHNIDYDILSFQKMILAGERKDLDHLAGDEIKLSREMYLSFALIDSRGKIVYDTRLEGNLSQPELLGSTKLMTNWKENPYFSDSWQRAVADFAYIKLAHPVGEGYLEFSETQATKTEPLYSIGFPTATWSREMLDKVPNSDGVSQYLTYGTAAEPRKALEFMVGPDFVRNPKPYMDTADEMFSHISFGDLESEPGQSGSPVLNAEGKVVGLLVGQLYQEQDVSQKVYLPYNHVFINANWILKQLKKCGP